MGLLGGKGGGKNALAAKPNLLSALRIQTSSYGQVIPILYGQNRIAARLIWAGDFTAIPHTSTTKVGGKGLGTGGGNSVSNTTYTYQTAVAMALCMGPIVNIQNVWDTKGRLTLLSTSTSFVVPPGGGGVTIFPPGSGVFHSIRGISRADAFSVNTGPNGDFGSDGTTTLTGTQKTPLKQVSGTPGAGQYSQSGSTFTFSSADQNQVMTINYVYSVPDSNSNGAPQQKLSLTLFTGTRPQTPWSYLTSAHPGQDLGYNGIAYAASSAMDLGESGTMPNLSFEVLGVLPFGGAITDAEPSAIIADLLANPFYGLAGVVTPGDLTQYRTFCTANGLFLSPVLDAQKTAAAWIQEILDITNAAAVWSEGVLKIVPYGDTTSVGNGATFIPNTQPIYDLTTSDLLSQVVVKRPSVAEVMNAVSVEWTNRSNDYNMDVAEDKDDAMIALYGLRKAQPVQAHSITTKEMAKFAANLLRKRSVEIRATYTFNLGWQFNLLEPMDLVTLTVPELGYNRKPVRITAMREDENGTIQIDAEDFPWGTATPTLYPHQPGAGFVPQANADPGPVNVPVIFEANDRLSLTGNYEVWIGASGGHSNLLVKSEQFNDPAWTTANVTSVTQNSVVDPLGGMTAAAVVYSALGTSTNIGQLVTPASSPANKPVTFSCWIKAASGSPSINMLIEDQTFAVIANQTFTLNQTWQRFSVTGTAGGGATGIRCFLYLPSSTSIAYHYWGAQLEQASSPSAYIKTTTAPLTVAVPDWGGCSVWVSPDNITYAQAGKIFGPSRMGVLTAQLPSAADPDTADTLAIDVTQSAGILNSASQADCDNFRTLCFVDGELISYQAATLTSASHYNLGTRLRRGVFGSPIGTHNANSAFLRLDDGVFVWEADPTLVGTTIFFKFTSFNRFGLMEQSLANATAYSFAFNGLFGNANEMPANNATIDSVFVSGTNDNIRIYGPGGPGTAYTAQKQKDQNSSRTIPAQTVSVVHETGASPQVNTIYWVSYDFNAATHNVWNSFNDYIQALYRGQMRIGSVQTVASSGGGGTSGGGFGGGSGGQCPEIDTWVNPSLQLKDVKPGDLFDCYRDGRYYQVPLHGMEIEEAECFLVCAGRAAKIVSWDTRFDLPDGSWLRCYQMEGKPVLTDDGWQACKIFHVGRRVVAKVDLGGETFAGSVNRNGCRVFSHNFLPYK